jgi:phosphohistidine phosphatase SixA
LFEAHPPPKGQSIDYSTAGVLAAAWWELSEWLSTPALAERRDTRYASRIRGALASLRKTEGDEATLLLVVHRPHVTALVSALEANSNPEEISSTATDSTHMEEE